MAPSTTLETLLDTTGDVTSDQETKSGLLSAITEGLTTLQAWHLTPNNTVVPPTAESTAESTVSNYSADMISSVTSALPSLHDVTSEMMSSEAVTTTSQVTTTPMTTPEGFIAEVTSGVAAQGGNNVMGGLGDVYTVIMTTEEPGFTLSPMHKWFIATGTVIALVFILIIINCFLSNKEKLEKTVKDAKHYAAEEKKVRREQNQINMESTRANSNQTHVFFFMGKKGGSQ